MKRPLPLVNISLSQVPSIKQAGLGLHGFTNRQTFDLKGLYGLHLYQYEGTLEINGEQIGFLPDELTLTPPDTELTWTFPQVASHYYVHFATAGSRTDTFPLKITTSLRSRELIADFEYICTHHNRNPIRAEVRLWNLLFKLKEDSPQQESTDLDSAAVQIAISEITNHLHQPLRVNELAKTSGVSPNYLTRLFKESCGYSPAQYIIHLRKAKAHYLITETSMPLKSVAACIGVPDLQHFNKFIRKHFGSGPRELREVNRK